VSPAVLSTFDTGAGSVKAEATEMRSLRVKSLGFSVKAESTEMRSLRVKSLGFSVKAESTEMRSLRVRAQDNTQRSRRST